MKPEIIEKIREHYIHAQQKHPYFCDELIPQDIDESILGAAISRELASSRIDIKKSIEKGDVSFSALLNCEVWEIHEAVFCRDTTAAVEECYDAIAVLLRTIDVLEGRQALGDPAKKGKVK